MTIVGADGFALICKISLCASYTLILWLVFVPAVLLKVIRPIANSTEREFPFLLESLSPSTGVVPLPL